MSRLSTASWKEALKVSNLLSYDNVEHVLVKYDSTHVNILRIKIKAKFTLENATKVQKGRRGIALLFLQPRRQTRGGWSTSRPDRFTPGKDPVLIV